MALQRKLFKQVAETACNPFIPFSSDFKFHTSLSCEVTVIRPHFTLSSMPSCQGLFRPHQRGAKTQTQTWWQKRTRQWPCIAVLGVGNQPEGAERQAYASGVLLVCLPSCLNVCLVYLGITAALLWDHVFNSFRVLETWETCRDTFIHLRSNCL